MPKPQKLTLAKVKAAARRAYKAGKLMAQYPIKSRRECRYVGPEDGGYGCAIGVALSKSTRKLVVERFYNNNDVGGLRAAGLITLPEEEWDAVKALQYDHDAWTLASRQFGARDHNTRNAKRTFLERIDL